MQQGLSRRKPEHHMMTFTYKMNFPAMSGRLSTIEKHRKRFSALTIWECQIWTSTREILIPVGYGCWYLVEMTPAGIEVVAIDAEHKPMSGWSIHISVYYSPAHNWSICGTNAILILYCLEVVVVVAAALVVASTVIVAVQQQILQYHLSAQNGWVSTAMHWM